MNPEEMAWKELDRLTMAPGGPGSAWRWSIPAKPDRDSDLILAAGLQAIADERDAAAAKLAQIAALCDENDPHDRYAPANVTISALRAVLASESSSNDQDGAR